MGTLLMIWAVLAITLAGLTGNPGRSAGLPLAYFLQLSIIHVPGALIYLDAQDIGSSAATNKLGFEETVIGCAAFVVAVIIVRSIPSRSGTAYRATDTGLNSVNELVRDDTLAIYYLLIGSAVYFLAPFLSAIPSASSVLSGLGSLIIVGACLRLWVAKKLQSAFKLWS